MVRKRKSLPLCTGAISGGNKLDIKARIPGKIIAIPVKAGDEVKAKSILCKMEGLKMEQTLYCPVDGVVRELNAFVGDKVESGQVIMIID